MQDITKSNLYNNVISDENIFSAIYSLDSYIFEVDLLNESDLKFFYKLKDKYNKKLIESVIKKCKERIERILKTDEVFNINVYFKAKKYNVVNDDVECRPMHSADLITQICIVSMLNSIMFKSCKNGKRELSDLSQLLPSNFFGNIPSTDPERIFYDWKIKYKAYTEKVIESYNIAKCTNSYKYEVCLDLEKYFPSISPTFIYNYSLDKLGVIYKDCEFDCLKVILNKLLYFNIANLNSKESIREYYKGYCSEIEGEFYPNIGIPQGLPQSYFFGNICMVTISKAFEKTFPGESFFYVDDSVIYTNSDNAQVENFKNSLENLNNVINNSINDVIAKNTEQIDCNYINKNIYRLSKKISYRIRVHEKEKSTTAEINNSFKMSKSYLMSIAYEASRTSVDINTTFDSIQDINLYKKIKALVRGIDEELKSIVEEIKIIDDKIDEFEKSNYNDDEKLKIRRNAFEIYGKSLKRYKKFFLYREKLLEFRNSFNIKNIQDEFEKKYFFSEDKFSVKHKKDIFDKFDEDIFLAEAQLIYTNILDKNQQNYFKISLEEFEKKLIGNISKENLYFAQIFKKKMILKNEYSSLERIAQESIPDFSKCTSDLQVTFLKDEFNEVNQLSSLWLGYGNSYDKYIFKFSNEYKRKIINTYLSKIFNVELSNNIESSRIDKRALKYYELRILTYIRNRNYDIDCFYDFTRKVISDYSENSYEKVDFSLYDVLDIFRIYVKEPNLIDKLILVHKYISSIWRNGSRFLYFYTLHNHEHSVELIVSSVNICKTIDYLQIKSFDYYILFLSCYLHDISMVLQPDINLFTQENLKTDEIYTSFLEVKSQIESEMLSEKQKEKNLMKKSFEKVSDYFEVLVRDNHAKDSSDFIKNSMDLDFIELPVRSIVSGISEAHNYNTNDVYGVRSTAKSDVISEKYMMILLRIADLLDIAKDRVSLNILRHNIKNMPQTSQYHWVTHAAIDRFKISSSYEFIGVKSSEIDRFNTLLKKENLIENIIVEIFINASNLTKIESLNCEDARATLTESGDEILIEIGKGKKCDSGQCNFLCKWMLKKNEYLLKELNALQLYLDRNTNNIFTTKINIKLNFSKSTPLLGDHFDIVSKQIL